MRGEDDPFADARSSRSRPAEPRLRAGSSSGRGKVVRLDRIDSGHVRHTKNRFDLCELRAQAHARESPSILWSACISITFATSGRPGRIARIARDLATGGFTFECAWSAVTLVAATRRETSMRPGTSNRRSTRSRARPSQAKNGRGAISTSFGSSECRFRDTRFVEERHRPRDERESTSQGTAAITISIRRFCARPSGVALPATGRFAPSPSTRIPSAGTP
jgi:hypothetical protein